MKKKRFTPEQIAFALRQHEGGTSVAEILRKLAISEQTFYRWKKKYAGLDLITCDACECRHYGQADRQREVHQSNDKGSP